jgi:HAD superfamily hydrolase (TIGR01509 family)
VIRSVIFDCDGVLVDTEHISNRVLAGMLTDAGLPTTFEDCMRDYRGRAMPAVLAMASQRHGGALPDDLADRYYAEVKRVFAHELEPVPGVVAALDRIELPSCVASSGPHHKMAMTLRHTGLWERFEGRIFSASEVQHGKPAPDLFLHAASSMGVKPAECVVVEDSPLGVAAANAAGMKVFGFAAMTAPEKLASADAVFREMTALPSLISAA